MFFHLHDLHQRIILKTNSTEKKKPFVPTRQPPASSPQRACRFLSVLPPSRCSRAAGARARRWSGSAALQHAVERERVFLGRYALGVLRAGEDS